MYFWDLNAPQDKVAVIEQSGKVHSYGQLQFDVDLFKSALNPSKKQLGLVLCQNHYQGLVAYIGALQKGDAVMLLDENMDPNLLSNILQTYQPQWISTKRGSIFNGYEQARSGFYINKLQNQQEEKELYSELAVLLSTSGTTGSVKFVRLSYQNLLENASSIATYMQLTEDERPILSLPIQYSYGLSVINSHFEAGASILLTNESVVSKEFWSFLKSEKATSLAGVPYTYEMLQRLRFERMDVPSLKTLTQAGGRLAPRLVEFYEQITREQGQRFYVMYGQTEATARISYVPPEMLGKKIGSIGVAIPGGKLSLDETTSELIYTGKNVMLGYAHNRNDLTNDDDMNGKLFTGDIAQVDEDGYYNIIGRKKRFLKLFGLRVSLDDIEKAVEQKFQTTVACIGNDDKMSIFITNQDVGELVKAFIGKMYSLHHRAYAIFTINELPRLVNGKVDYEKLKDMIQ
ncbi:MAG: AMP-binding protein [Bacillaceae bacterium]|nr:AMP-binding protein [Bacillaceae bacterium]